MHMQPALIQWDPTIAHVEMVILEMAEIVSVSFFSNKFILN